MVYYHLVSICKSTTETKICLKVKTFVVNQWLGETKIVKMFSLNSLSFATLRSPHFQLWVMVTSILSLWLRCFLVLSSCWLVLFSSLRLWETSSRLFKTMTDEWARKIKDRNLITGWHCWQGLQTSLSLNSWSTKSISISVITGDTIDLNLWKKTISSWTSVLKQLEDIWFWSIYSMISFINLGPSSSQWKTWIPSSFTTFALVSNQLSLRRRSWS